MQKQPNHKENKKSIPGLLLKLIQMIAWAFVVYMKGLLILFLSVIIPEGSSAWEWLEDQLSALDKEVSIFENSNKEE